MSDRPSLTIKEAAESCGVHPKTIRRRLDEFPNAHRLGGNNGAWMIPVTDLIAAGLHPGKPTPPDEPSRAEPDHDQVLELERKLTAAEHRARIAETERDAARAELRRADQVIETQAAALRMLEPARAPESAVDTDQTPAAPDTAPTSERTLIQRLTRPFRTR